jgi:hypothetical protein
MLAKEIVIQKIKIQNRANFRSWSKSTEKMSGICILYTLPVSLVETRQMETLRA